MIIVPGPFSRETGRNHTGWAESSLIFGKTLRGSRTSIKANADCAVSNQTSDQRADAWNPVLSSQHQEHVFGPAMQVRHVVISWERYLLERNCDVSTTELPADPKTIMFEIPSACSFFRLGTVSCCFQPVWNGTFFVSSLISFSYKHQTISWCFIRIMS